MGIQNLWELIESTGRPLNLEELSGKIIAIDISIWLHQAGKGMVDKEGNKIVNAHLVSIFKRISKLLFYGIKPVVVFDGSVPQLKLQTIALRKSNLEKAISLVRSTENARVQNLMLKCITKKDKLGANKKIDIKKSGQINKINKYTDIEDDLFKLPAIREPTHMSSDDDSTGEVIDYKKYPDLEKLDYNSPDFHSLPNDIKLELLLNAREKAKKCPRNKLHKFNGEHSEIDDSFSQFQFKKLIEGSSILKELEKVRSDVRSEAHSTFMKDLPLGKSQASSGYLPSLCISVCDSNYALFKGLSSSKQIKFETNTDKSLDTNDEGFIKDNTENRIAEKFVMKSRNDCNDVGKDDAANVKQFLNSKRSLSDNSSNSSSDIEDLMVCNKSEYKFKNKKIDHVLDVGSKSIESTATNDKALDTYISSFETDSDNDFIEVNTTEDHNSNISDSAANELNSLVCELNEENKLIQNNLSNTSLNSKYDAIYSNDSSTIDASNYSNTELVSSESDVNDDIQMNDNDENNIVKETLIFEDSTTLESTDHAIEKDYAFEGINSTENIGIPNISTDGLEDINNLEAANECNVVTELSDGAMSNTSDLNSKCNESQYDKAYKNKEFLNEETLNNEIKRLDDLRNHQNKKIWTINDQIVEEVQQLLQHFGIPFITSPTEAEAQCAYLDMTGQTNGTISEDSDIWPFGGLTVIKNVFSRKKNILIYKMNMLTEQLGLNRDLLIGLAMLTGSDYSVGISGVGPVTALEILSEFKGIDALARLTCMRDFCQEIDRYPMDFIPTRMRNILKKLIIPEGFPNAAVYQAFMHPSVDESKVEFKWDRPNLDGLRRFAEDNLGWSQIKVDELILPVLKTYNKNNSCSNHLITDYYNMNSIFSNRSNRLKKAIGKIKSTSNSIDANNRNEATKKKKVPTATLR